MLTETDELEAQLSDPGLRIIDCDIVTLVHQHIDYIDVTEVTDVRDLYLNRVTHVCLQSVRGSQHQVAHVRQDERDMTDETRRIGAVDHAVVVRHRERLDQPVDDVTVHALEAFL